MSLSGPCVGGPSKERPAALRLPQPFPWHVIPKGVTEACDSGNEPKTYDRQTMVQNIANFMIEDLQSYSLGTAKNLASTIVSKWPNSFAVKTVSGLLISDGVKQLQYSIYDRVNYLKPKHLKCKRKSGCEANFEEQTDDVLECTSRIVDKYDEFGCLSFEPMLPPEESVMVQEEKRTTLTKDYGNTSLTKNQVSTLMKETYPSQRAFINHRPATRSVENVLVEWPYLQEMEYFFAHSSTLLGKDVVAEWTSSLAAKGPKILSFLKKWVENKRPSNDRTKNSIRLNRMIDTIEESTAAAINLKCETPKLIAVIPLLMDFFGDDHNLLFRVTEVHLFHYYLF